MPKLELKHYIIAAVLVALTVIGLVVYADVHRQIATEAHDQSLIARGEAQNAILQAEQIAVERDQFARAASSLTARVAELEARRPPKPAPPAPVPVLDEDLQRSLVASGVSGALKVTTVLPPALTPEDARLVAGWKAQADRIPAFEARVGSDSEIIQAQKDLDLTRRSEIRICGDQVKQLSAASSSYKAEGLALRKENEALLSAQVATRYKTRIILGVSIPAALWVGWRLRR